MWNHDSAVGKPLNVLTNFHVQQPNSSVVKKRFVLLYYNFIWDTTNNKDTCKRSFTVPTPKFQIYGLVRESSRKEKGVAITPNQKVKPFFIARSWDKQLLKIEKRWIILLLPIAFFIVVVVTKVFFLFLGRRDNSVRPVLSIRQGIYDTVSDLVGNLRG